MSDTFTVTTRTSWFTRLKNSVIGVLIGLLLIVIMVVLLFWNEGRAVQTSRSLAEGASAVVDISADTYSAENEGKLVHLTGQVTTPETPSDPTFGISAAGVRLERRAEMFQWKESSESKSEDKLGGGQETTTTYTYSKVWDDDAIDSSRFKQPNGHQNPSMEIRSQDFQVGEAKLGAFALSTPIISMIGGEKTYPVPADRTQAVQDAFGGGKKVGVVDGRIFLGSNASSPVIGDYRISYQLAPAGTISLIGKQVGMGFGGYQTLAGDELLMVDVGTVSAEQMFKDAATVNTVITWLLRVVGLVFLWVGFALILGPLSAIGMVVPFVGRLIGTATGLIGLFMALAVGTVTIAIAWFWYRPVLALIILVVGFAITYLVGRMAKSKVKATAPAAPQAA